VTDAPHNPKLPADVTAISRPLHCAIVDFADGTSETIAITNWFDDSGDEIPHEDAEVAVSAVAGPCEAGQWYVIDLEEFEASPAPH
jgi:hypothetical protein